MCLEKLDNCQSTASTQETGTFEPPPPTDEEIMAFKACLTEELNKRVSDDWPFISADGKPGIWITRGVNPATQSGPLKPATQSGALRPDEISAINNTRKVNPSTWVYLKGFGLRLLPLLDAGPCEGETVADRFRMTPSTYEWLDEILKKLENIWDIPTIEQECKSVEVNNIPSEKQIWKLKFCSECQTLFLADYQSQKFHRKCSSRHRRQTKTDWQNVPENKAVILSGKRGKYRKKKRGKVRHYFRQSTAKTIR
jgi:hypothetical protein